MYIPRVGLLTNTKKIEPQTKVIEEVNLNPKKNEQDVKKTETHVKQSGIGLGVGLGVGVGVGLGVGVEIEVKLMIDSVNDKNLNQEEERFDIKVLLIVKENNLYKQTIRSNL